MFSSNLVQQLSSSIHVYPPSSSLFDLEKDGVHFNHHHHHYHHHHHHHNNQFVNGDCFFHAYNNLAPPPVLTDNIMVRQQQICKQSGFHYNNDHNNLLEAVIYPYKKKIPNMKKDGHSKIYTAQGPRDRRVRMSIDVARKFFYLQDLLGFDKASKTLNWLFTESKTAIKELVEEMKHFSSPGATDQCEVVFQEILKARSDEEEQEQEQKKKSASKCVGAKKKRKYRSVVDVNQSRAEARARARERTKEKLQNKNLESNERRSTTSELIMEPKVPMSSSVVYGYQHNVLVPNDSSSQIKYTSFLNLY